MKEFHYVTDLHVQVWSRLNLTITASSKEEADAIIIRLAQKEPSSLLIDDDNRVIADSQYLFDTETLVEGKNTVYIFNKDNKSHLYLPEDAIYRNIANENAKEE